MIPLFIERSGKRPWVTILFAIMVAGVFVVHHSMLGSTALIQTIGLVPVRAWSVESWRLLGWGEQVGPWLFYPWFHASALHLIGNVWGLWVFGGAIERDRGPWGFIVVWLVTSIGAGVTYILIQPDQISPLIGASGSVAGMIGFCCLRSIGARVGTWVPWNPFHTVFLSPWAFVLAWTAVTIAAVSITARADLATAGWIHGGGFVLGALCGLVVRYRHPKNAEQIPFHGLNDGSSGRFIS